MCRWSNRVKQPGFQVKLGRILCHEGCDWTIDPLAYRPFDGCTLLLRATFPAELANEVVAALCVAVVVALEIVVWVDESDLVSVHDVNQRAG